MLADLLMRRFKIDADGADELIGAARDADSEAVDLYGFTSVLKRRLDAGRAREAGRDDVEARLRRRQGPRIRGQPHLARGRTSRRLLGGADPPEAGGPRPWRRLTGKPDPDRPPPGAFDPRAGRPAAHGARLSPRHPAAALRRSAAGDARRPCRRGHLRRPDERQRQRRISSAARPTGSACRSPKARRFSASASGRRCWRAISAPRSGRTRKAGSRSAITSSSRPRRAAALMKWPDRVHHFHREGFGLADGATLLAAGDVFPNQAFSYGPAAFALQFHIELTTAMVGRWTRRTAESGAAARRPGGRIPFAGPRAPRLEDRGFPGGLPRSLAGTGCARRGSCRGRRRVGLAICKSARNLRRAVGYRSLNQINKLRTISALIRDVVADGCASRGRALAK